MPVKNERVVLVVVDPAQDKPIALERALRTAKRTAADPTLVAPKLHIFIAVDCDNSNTAADNPAMHRNRSWLFEHIITPLADLGLEYDIAMSWSSDWYGSILAESQKIQPELLMLPLMTRPSSHERIFNESIWRLLRTAKCPVLVVRPDSPQERKIILAAIDIQSHKPEYQRLNDLILSRGKWLAKHYGADLQVVNAYKNSLNYPDRAQLANKTGVNTAKIHVQSGSPDKVIATVVHEIGADLVLLGTCNRANRWRGNTSEKIITQVNYDILAIN